MAGGWLVGCSLPVMDLRKFSDEQLLDSTLALAGAERRLVCALLHHLNEIAARALYAKESFPSMFEYCVRVLGFTENQAQTRVCAARLLQELPEIECKITNGQLALTSASKAFVFFRQQTMGREQKLSFLGQLENKSARDVEKTIRAILPHAFRERTRVISETHTEYRFAADQELVKKLEHLRNLLRAKSTEQLIRKIADISLSKFKEDRRVTNRRNASITLPVKITRHIPAHIRRLVWARDGGRCTYPNCASEFALELDHIIPFAKGGQHSAENLRLRCPAHNQLHALQEFGEKNLGPRRKMSSHKRA